MSLSPPHILYILDAIPYNFTNCTFESCDVEPCATDCDDHGAFEDGSCELNVLDTFAILDNYNGYIACCGGQPLGGMGGMSASSSGAGTAELMLEVREVGSQEIATYEVDVYASHFVDLRAYEVGDGPRDIAMGDLNSSGWRATPAQKPLW